MGRFPRSAAFGVVIALVTATYTTTALADDRIVTKARSAVTQAPWPTPAIPPPAFAPPTDPGKSVWDWTTTQCELTWHGVRAYGFLDMGGSYQINGVLFNGMAVYGTEYLIQKNSNRALWTLTPNAMSNSVVGVQAFVRPRKGVRV